MFNSDNGSILQQS